jgi:hypothetical protein
MRMPWVSRSQSRGWAQGTKLVRRVMLQARVGRVVRVMGEKRVSSKALGGVEISAKWD